MLKVRMQSTPTLEVLSFRLCGLMFSLAGIIDAG